MDFVSELYRRISGPIESIDFDDARKVFHISAPWLLKATTSLTPMGRMAGMGYAALAESAIITAYAASWAGYLYDAKVVHNVPTALMMTSLAAQNLVESMDREEIAQQKAEILAVSPWVPLEWPY